MKRLRISFWF